MNLLGLSILTLGRQWYNGNAAMEMKRICQVIYEYLLVGEFCKDLKKVSMLGKILFQVNIQLPSKFVPSPMKNTTTTYL